MLAALELHYLHNFNFCDRCNYVQETTYMRTCVSASKTEVIEDGYKSSFTEDPRQQMSMKFTYFNILPPHFSL